MNYQAVVEAGDVRLKDRQGNLQWWGSGVNSVVVGPHLHSPIELL